MVSNARFIQKTPKIYMILATTKSQNGKFMHLTGSYFHKIILALRVPLIANHFLKVITPFLFTD